MKKKYSIIILLLVLVPFAVKAHPGRTDSSGCHYCRTNCSKYGLSDGEYHCHNGGTTSNNNQQTPTIDNNNSQNETQNNNTQTEEVKEEVKNNDNTLKSIIIDNNNIDINDNIEYETYNEKINIEVETNDEKATYEIKNNNTLLIGENNIIIEVKAEDGNIKNYNIKVIRNKKLSSDTGIKVIIDKQEIEFDNYKATIYVDYDKENIDFDYTLNDSNAKVELNKIEELKEGDNIIKIKVIAEDSTIQNYEINIYKNSKTNDIFSTITSLGVIGGIGYLIYTKKKK